MLGIIKLTCPSCETKLIINNTGIKQFICNTCGKEFLVRRTGGITYLEEMNSNVEHDEHEIQVHNYQTMVSVDQFEAEPAFEGPKKQVGEETTFVEPNLVDFNEFIISSGDDITFDKLEGKISKLQNNKNKLMQTYKKNNVGIVIFGFILITIFYILLPKFDIYEDLFATLALFIVPIIIFVTFYLMLNQKTMESNQKFIDARIVKLQKEKVTLGSSHRINEKLA